MTLADIDNDTSFLTNTNQTGYTAAQRLISLNAWYHKIVTMILLAQDSWDFDDFNKTDYPIATTPMTTNRDYSFPRAFTSTSKLLKIQRVDVTYNGTDYYKAEPFDQAETGLGLGNDDKTDNRFDRSAPKYDLLYNSLWIYPRASSADVAAGAQIRIQFSREVTEFTSSDYTTGTKEPGFDTPFHRMLSIGMAHDYAMSRNLPNLTYFFEMLKDYEIRLKQHYGTKDIDRKYRFAIAENNYE